MTQHRDDGGRVPSWVVQEIGRLNLEMLLSQQRIRELELEQQAVEHEEFGGETITRDQE